VSVVSFSSTIPRAQSFIIRLVTSASDSPMRTIKFCSAVFGMSTDKNDVQTWCHKQDLRPHSITLASCKPGFRPGLQPGFRQVPAGVRHAFDQLSTFLSKTWSRTATGSLVRGRARQMECRKKTVLSKFAAGF